ncbi:MAG: transposase [Acidobacteriota bacterium]|nr:transposase [Acidobacteriota bacterium]
MKFLDERFQLFTDPRANNSRYALASVLKAAFAMFSLKSPSLLDFKQQTLPEQNNLRMIYRIPGEIPCDNQMRAVLDAVEVSAIRAVIEWIFKQICRVGLLQRYRYWQKYVLVSIDGVEHFSSTKVHCPSCLTRKNRAGEVSYHHAGLAAVLVHPEQREVFPLDFEPIVKQDGERKNDCERNAAKRLCRSLCERYPRLSLVVVEDALYANAPHIRQISGYGWKYILTVKEAGQEKLFKQFESRRTSGQVKELVRVDEKGVEHYYGWTNQLWFGEKATDLKVNFLLYEQCAKGAETKRWTWITNLPLNACGVEKVARGGRARWKIENETFNTLKNQGYHFSHNYGHGYRNLASVLALLMLLAFLVDQIQQGFDKVFQQLWKGLGSKSKLWEMVRNVFRILMFQKMELLYRHIAILYQLQLE